MILKNTELLKLNQILFFEDIPRFGATRVNDTDLGILLSAFLVTLVSFLEILRDNHMKQYIAYMFLSFINENE
jgi:hypothetical protein